MRNPPYTETEIPVTPTHPTERVTVTHELPVPKSPETVFNVDDDCHNDGIDCDLFPGVTAFRRRFISNFIFAHLNINSYRYKYISLHDILAKKHVDYLAISESKLDASFPSAQLPADDFSLYRQDVSSSSGGLLIYVRADLPHRRLNYAEINEHGFESLCMEITVGKTTIVVACIYKHPKLKNDAFKCYLSNMADSLFRTHSDLVFLGDMNCCPSKSTTIQYFCEIYGLTNLITEPTCHKGDVSTLLDVILVTNPRRYLGTLNSECNISDFHNIIGAATRRFALSLKPQTIIYRSYKSFNDADFLFDLQCAPFHVMNIFDDADDMAWYTSTLISDVIDSHAPVKSKFVKRQSVPYMNSGLRKALYSRNMARNKFRIFGKKYWEENRRLRNHVVSLRKKSIAKYFENNCAKQDRTFWRTISPFFSDKKFRNGNHTILREGEDIIVDSNEVAEIFNVYFSSIASEIGFQDQHSTIEEAILAHDDHPSVIKIRDAYGENAHSFNFEMVSHDCISKTLRMINVRKATGYDNIPAKLLRLAQNELTYPITNLVNNSISMSTFPDQLKCAELSPLYKKEDNLNRNNFRPVSILTGISKLYESVVNDRLLEFFSRLFRDLIGAFRKGYSCQSLLVKCIDNWKSALDKQHYIGALFMDLSKAFDCLPHGLIIAKLHAYGLKLPACNLLFSYLHGRKQRVKISNSRSSWTLLTKGVPQGSILGPLLFNIFMNDLFLFIEKCHLYNYADDNSLDSSSENLTDVLYNLRHDGRNAIEWFAKNGMQANPDKFHFMLFSPTPSEQQALQLCDGTHLMSETEVTVPGVTIDDKSCFSQHISSCCKKAARQLNALARISRHLDSNSRRAVYNSFIMSNFNYCPLVWHFCGQVNNQKLEQIQERALRILFADYNSSYLELLKRAGTTTLLIQRLRLIALIVFKSLHGLNPPCLNDMFTPKYVPYQLRDSSLLEQSRCRTTTYGLRSMS